MRTLATSDTGSTTIALGSAFTPTSGGCVFIGVDWTGSTTATVADAVNGTYVSTTISSNGTDHTQIFGKCGVAASSITPTATFSGSSTFRRLKVGEYSGATTTVDRQNQANGNSTAPSVTLAATTNASDLIVVSIQSGNIDTWTAGSSQNLRQPPSGTSDSGWEDRIVAATGTYTGNATLSSSGTWAISVVAFQASGAAAVSHRLSLTGAGPS